MLAFENLDVKVRLSHRDGTGREGTGGGVCEGGTEEETWT